MLLLKVLLLQRLYLFLKLFNLASSLIGFDAERVHFLPDHDGQHKHGDSVEVGWSATSRNMFPIVDGGTAVAGYRPATEGDGFGDCGAACTCLMASMAAAVEVAFSCELGYEAQERSRREEFV